ncbi:phage tail protein [Microbacterium sp.]|uniref:phage tail tube protein n=1 Tax=Microbacterium sp. TaxID=51671 RepID=UPI003A8CC634
MSNNASNVSVGKPKASGGIYSAAITETAPTDATTALAATFKGLGYVSDAGLTNTIETSSEKITEWGGDTVLTVRTSRDETFKFTFIETNADVLKEVYGQSNVTVTEETGDIAVLHNAAELDQRLYVFEIAMTGKRVKRIVVPLAKVDEVGDVVYAAGEPIGYEVTLATSPDAAGNTAYEYIAAVV